MYSYNSHGGYHARRHFPQHLLCPLTIHPYPDNLPEKYSLVVAFVVFNWRSQWFWRKTVIFLNSHKITQILRVYCVQWSLHVTTIKLLLPDILTTKIASLIHSPFNYVSIIMNKSTNTIKEHLELSPVVHIKYRYVNSW